MLKFACKQLPLLLAFVVVTVGKHRNRHSRSDPSDISLVSPCTLPSITNASFEPICASNLRKRFICVLPTSTLLPVTLWTHLEEIIAGRFAYCRFDSLRRVAYREEIGDEEIIKQWERMEVARFERLRDAQREQQQLQPRENRPEPLNMRPMATRPTFSLTILDMYNRNEHRTSRGCGVRLPNALKNDKHPNTHLLFNYYANVTRYKWSLSTCHTDIAVLIVGNPDFQNQSDPPMILRVALSERFHHIMGLNVTMLVHELSAKYRNLNELKDMLFFLLHGLVALLESEYPVSNGPIQHTVPTWALCAFAGCIIVSALAAALGTWVSDRGGLRSVVIIVPGLGRKAQQPNCIAHVVVATPPIDLAMSHVAASIRAPVSVVLSLQVNFATLIVAEGLCFAYISRSACLTHSFMFCTTAMLRLADGHK